MASADDDELGVGQIIQRFNRSCFELTEARKTSFNKIRPHRSVEELSKIIEK